MKSRSLLKELAQAVYQTSPLPFYGYLTSGYVILDSQHFIIIDAPPNIQDYTAQIDKLTARLGSHAIRKHILTHSHKTISDSNQRFLQQKYGMTTLHPTNYSEIVKLTCRLKLIPAPGHTSDSIIISYQAYRLGFFKDYWFTGDTLMVSDDQKLHYSIHYSDDISLLKTTLGSLIDYNPQYICAAIGHKYRVLPIASKEHWKQLLESLLKN